jgi:D-psicose/D-tagatose/L-ribulose 3-epimerase
MTQGDARSNAIGVHQLVWVPGWSDSECDWALQATKEAGYDFIEIALLDPSSVDGVRTRKQLANYGLSASCSLGLSFDTDISSPDPDVVQRGEALLREALDVASALGAQYLGGVIYSALGKYRAPAAVGAKSQVAAVLRRVADKARERDITIGLEVVNRYETNLVNCARQALALIELTGAANMVVHLDVYHMNIEEGDLERPVIECGDRLGYVHIGESHRGYLGTGTIDFPQFFRALARVHYSGPIAFESFSSAVISTDFCSALAVWRDLWDDGEDLARQARQFIQQQLDAARRAVVAA